MKSRAWAPSARPGRSDLNSRAGPPRGDLVVLDLHDRDHLALMVLVRSVHVEKFQPGPLRRLLPLRQHLRNQHVERVLGPAVQVQRPQPLQRRQGEIVIETLRPVAVGRRRGGIDQRHASRGAPFPQIPAEFDVRRPGVVAVHGGGFADRAEVEHHLQRRIAVEESVEVVRMDDPRRRVFGEVAPFAVAAEAIDNDGFMPAAHQRRLQVGADESGAASYQDHGCAIYPSGAAAKAVSQTGA